MSSARDTDFEKQHLWMYLQALGLDPSPGVTVGGKMVSHAHLGDFLFFVSNTGWISCQRSFQAECGSGFPQVVGSLFLFPGGPKFIHLMYHFARFVAIKYIKTKSNDSLRIAETFNAKPQDMHKCLARCHVARNRFLQILQREHYVIQKYQENAHLSIKQVRNLRSECMVLQNQIKRQVTFRAGLYLTQYLDLEFYEMDPCDDQSNIQEKIQKVRFLWTSVNETLKFLEKEREVVSSVFSLVNQCVLDGTNVAINIPRLLLDRIEEQICQLQMGNVYEAGKLNLLTIIQLLNEVLKVMKYEHCKTGQARLTIDLPYLEKETKFQRERLSDMKHMRHKIKENITAIRHSILEKEGKWHMKWKGGASAVDLLPPMSPLSFDPVSEEVHGKSTLLKYLASLPDIHKEHNQESRSRREADTLGAVCDLANSPVPFSLQCAPSSDTNSFAVLEKDPNMRTPKEKNIMSFKKVPNSVEDSPLSDIAMNTQTSVFRGSLPAKKSDPFQKEQDLLVEEACHPASMHMEPGLKQELLTEIRNSWRKTVETEDNRSSEGILVDVKAREVAPESSPVLNNQRELSMAIFSSDFDQSYLPEEKTVPDQLRSVPQKPLVTSQIGDPPTEDESDLVNKKSFSEQDLECVTTRLSETGQMEAFSLAVDSGIDVVGRREEDSFRKSHHSQASCSEPSTRKTLFWDSFQRMSDIGILHETLPEEVGHLSLNSSTTSETNFRLEPNSYVHSDAFPDDDGKRQATPEVDSSFQAILSSYEALKKSLNKIRQESHLSNSKTLEQDKVGLSPVAKDMQADDTHTFLGTQDLFYTEPSSHMPFDERTQSLSPLTKVSLVEQKLRTTLPCSLREFLPNLKEKEISNKNLEARKPLI
ncbi:HAUS augmin-like complex subunit 6-like protein [Cricetulus griseus]|nr:HAUS augmin-like complex subunit 6-like protein [Cricetulus griseus]